MQVFKPPNEKAVNALAGNSTAPKSTQQLDSIQSNNCVQSRGVRRIAIAVIHLVVHGLRYITKLTANLIRLKSLGLALWITAYERAPDCKGGRE